MRKRTREQREHDTMPRQSTAKVSVGHKNTSPPLYPTVHAKSPASWVHRQFCESIWIGQSGAVAEGRLWHIKPGLGQIRVGGNGLFTSDVLTSSRNGALPPA